MLVFDISSKFPCLDSYRRRPMRNTLRTAVLTDQPCTFISPSALRKRQHQGALLATLFSPYGISKLSGLPHVQVLDTDEDSVLEMMVKLQMERDNEKREHEHETKVMRYQAYIPEYEIDDVDDLEATTGHGAAAAVSTFFARQSWPFTRTSGKKSNEQPAAQALVPVSEAEYRTDVEPVFPGTQSTLHNRPRNRIEDEEAVIPEDHLEKLKVLSNDLDKQLDGLQASSEQVDRVSVEDTIDKFIESQQLSLHAPARARSIPEASESATYFAYSRRGTEPSLTRDRGRMHSDGSKTISDAASIKGSAKDRLTIPHIASPWADDFEFVTGSRFLEEDMDEEKSPDTNEKVSIWTKLPKLSRKRSLSRKRTDAPQYVATRIPGAAQ